MTFLSILIAIAIIFGLGALEAWIVMLLWNNVVLALWTTGPVLSFWIAYGLLILLNIVGSCFKAVNSNK